MTKKILPFFMLLAFGCSSPSQETTSTEETEKNAISSDYYENGDYAALKASNDPVIDGLGNEKDWELVPWKTMDHVWLGQDPSNEDLSGRYKMLWTESKLYFLVEITDDSLSDQKPNSFDDWWEDDCLELFVDEDHSGGNHQFNHSAFAYHITLDYDVIDLGPDKKPHLYNDHMEVKRTKNGNLYTWEVAMKVFDDNFKDEADNIPVELHAGKKLGYAVSYNDNDGNGVRENFLGSSFIEGEGEERNKGWIDAGVFGTLRLLEKE